MPIDKVSSLLDTLALSYREMNEFGFNAQFTQDYLEQIRNILIISGKTDEIVDQVNNNTDRIDVLEPIVADNVSRLDVLEPIVADNASRIDALEPIVSDNTNRLDLLEPRVTANEDAIATANGQLVGNMDYATDLVGGVVNLAALISDLSQIATPDIVSAPATYDQAYTQSVTNLTNQNKAKINEIVLKINEIITGQITAKQMSNV